MTTMKESFERYDSTYLLERRALGDELSDAAHAAIEAVLQERGEPVPPRPQRPVRLADATPAKGAAGVLRMAGQVGLVLATLVLAKMLAHMWIGWVIGAGLAVYFVVKWIRDRTRPAQEREAARQKKVAERDGLTELMRSAADGDLARVQELLRYGAAVNATSLTGATALMYAARNNQLAVVEALLAGGADVNVRTPANGTALALAERFGHETLAASLRRHGAIGAEAKA